MVIVKGFSARVEDGETSPLTPLSSESQETVEIQPVAVVSKPVHDGIG